MNRDAQVFSVLLLLFLAGPASMGLTFAVFYLLDLAGLLPHVRPV